MQTWLTKQIEINIVLEVTNCTEWKMKAFISTVFQFSCRVFFNQHVQLHHPQCKLSWYKGNSNSLHAKFRWRERFRDPVRKINFLLTKPRQPVLAKQISERINPPRCIELNPISFPESSFPLTSGRKIKALGATISGVRHRCRLRSETGRAEFGYF